MDRGIGRTPNFALLTLTGLFGGLWIALLLVLAHTVLFLIMIISALLIGLVLSLIVQPRILSANALVVTGSVLAFISPYWFIIAGGPVFFVALSLFLLGLVAWTWGAGRIVRTGPLTES